MHQNVPIPATRGAALATQGRRAERALSADRQALSRQFARADVYDAALDAIVSTLGCSRASILLFDEAGEMGFVAWRGLSEGYRKAVAWPYPRGSRATGIPSRSS
jgi:GAF domain-containing protein